MGPTPEHQFLLGDLHILLGSFVREHGLGRVAAAPLDVVLSRHDIVEPDLLFVSKERLEIVGEKYLQGAPDLVVEVLYPSTRRRDLGQKRARYEALGVKEYWRLRRQGSDRSGPPPRRGPLPPAESAFRRERRPAHHAAAAGVGEGFGYRLARVAGNHHIFAHPAVPEPLNLQEVGGEAKAYQVRQLLRNVERYNLRLEDEP